MNPASHTNSSPSQVVRLLAEHKWRWFVPALVVGALAVVYTVVRTPTWEASQALIVRDEAANNEVRPGRFGHSDEMKTVQETILELVKGRGVLGAALEQVGPPVDYRKDRAAWPDGRDIAGLRKNVQLTPPNGAEFGRTEIFYLKVRDQDHARAVALNRAICHRLQARFQELRDAKAQSMIDELAKTVQMAKVDLDGSTARLIEIEKQVGGDLAELRTLNEPGSGESVLRRSITEIRGELRQTFAATQANRQLLVLLQDAEEDPGRLVATPNRLLESQPALRRLKEGLVDAQLRTAALKGTMSDGHPLVRSAMHAEEEIGRHLHDELAIATRGLQAELQMNENRRAMLAGQLAELNNRLGHLAQLRARYSNQLDETDNRSRLVERAEQNLADARATHASAKAASLISRIDSPDAGVNPIGPTRASIVLIGIVGGLLSGFGIVFLTVQPPQLVVEQPMAQREQTSQQSRQPEKTAALPSTSVPDFPVRGFPVRGFPVPGFPVPGFSVLGYTRVTPVFQPGSRLSVKQALQKIACGNAI